MDRETWTIMFVTFLSLLTSSAIFGGIFIGKLMIWYIYGDKKD